MEPLRFVLKMVYHGEFLQKNGIDLSDGNFAGPLSTTININKLGSTSFVIDLFYIHISLNQLSHISPKLLQLQGT